jgi:hypothetical protein
MSPTTRDSDDPAPIQPDCLGHASDDGTGHDAGPLPLGWERGQLSHGAPLFLHGHALGVLFWAFFRHHVYRAQEVYLLVADEVVVTKAGKTTYGLDRFFASLYGKPVPGLAFFVLSLVSVQTRRAFPMRVEHVVRSAAEKAASQAKAAANKAKSSGAKRRPGRPKGSQNTPKAKRPLPPELGRIAGMLDALRHLMAGFLSLTYLVLDGHFGHHHALAMAQQQHLHLISKRRRDAALYFPYTGP